MWLLLVLYYYWAPAVVQFFRKLLLFLLGSHSNTAFYKSHKEIVNLQRQNVKRTKMVVSKQNFFSLWLFQVLSLESLFGPISDVTLRVWRWWGQVIFGSGIVVNAGLVLCREPLQWMYQKRTYVYISLYFLRRLLFQWQKS